MGVVSLAQLRAVGLSDDAVLRRVRLGRLRRVHRGVYGVGGAVLPREGRWLAAVMACGGNAVLSHVIAAVHWGLLQYEPARPEVSAPASRIHRRQIHLPPTARRPRHVADRIKAIIGARYGASPASASRNSASSESSIE